MTKNNPDIEPALKADLKKALLEKARDGRLPCALARAVAERYGVAYRLIGQMADELKIKITNCELGCF